MRKLSGKTINSLALCVALAAPLVYLFGTLFMTLAGSHGTQMLAGEYESEQPSQTIEVDGVTYERKIYSDSKYLVSYTTEENMTWEIYGNNTMGGDYTTSTLPQAEEEDTTFLKCQWINGSVQWFPTNNTQRAIAMSWFSTNRFYWENYGSTIIRYDLVAKTTMNNNAFGVSANNTIWFSNEPIENTNKEGLDWLETVRKLPQRQSRELVNISETPKGYSNYLFGQFFASNNWLAESGREVLNGTPEYGFEPIGELVRYTDENMLHLANLSYGPLVIGYTYYCAHVIIVDLIFYIGSFIPRLIKKTINKLEGGLD